MIQLLNNNILYKLGKNAKQNFELIDEAIDINNNYWWFHLDDLPSGHCIIFNEVIDESMIKMASLLVKNNSKFKNQKVKIVYTQIRNVKKTNNLGEVLITNSKNFYL